MQQVYVFKDMQLCYITSKLQTWLFKTCIDFSNWKPTELQKSLKGWFVKYMKNKISQGW